MKTHQGLRRGTLLAAATALGIAIAALGCSGSKRAFATNTSTNPANSATATTPVAQTKAADSAPHQVTLTGCLQEGKDGSFIVTEINEPKRPDSSNPSVVERERLTAAEHAYRLTASNQADRNDLSRLVGKRVRIDGAVTKSSDLVAQKGAGEDATGTAGHINERAATFRNGTIGERDLANVEVSSVEKVANMCGSHARRRTHQDTRR